MPRIIVNVAYSYEVIIEAATRVQQLYQGDPSVNDLKFSPHWVRGFLTRANMRRRKITTDDKDMPEISEVKRIMGIGQKMISDHGFAPRQILNMDETAFTYAIGPEYIYCPTDQSRAQNVGVPNMKLRITAVVAVFATGDFAPLFIIIKHSVSSEVRPDQSKMTVVTNMRKKDAGFGIRYSGQKSLKSVVLLLSINVTTSFKGIQVQS